MTGSSSQFTDVVNINANINLRDEPSTRARFAGPARAKPMMSIRNNMISNVGSSGYLGFSKPRNMVTRMNHGRISNLKMLQTASSGKSKSLFKAPNMSYQKPRASNLIM